ncbi:MAG TPA: hypothetical protein IAC62_06515 [Candidatus Pelethocola excrementipullorum]|nr:hypothetical protein [Candidatus Pelethocola excrementipullorum]
MKYIGIDLGSSFIKAVFLDLDEGKVIAYRKHPTPRKEKNQNVNVFEIRASHIVDTVQALIDEFTSTYKDVEGVILSTQMHGFVYSVPNREDRYVSWQDMRCLDRMPQKDDSYLEWLQKEISPEQMERNGVYLKPSLGMCNLYTLLEEDEEMPRDGTLYTLGSYIIHSLTGNNVCHISNAAPLGIVDVASRCWDRKLLKELRMSNIKLPRLAQNDYEVCGTYNSNGCHLKVHPDYGDMQIAALGSQIGVGDIVVNVATAAQVIRYTKEFYPGIYEIRPYLEDSYLYTISNMPSGRNLDVLVNFFREIVLDLTGEEVDAQIVWKHIHEGRLHDGEGLKVETGFYKNPFFSEGGAIYGITQNNMHIDTICHAAIVDMSNVYWHYIQRLGEAPESIKRIICAGGVSWKTPELCQAIAEISGKKCQLSPIIDEALSGLYQVSLVCSGICNSIDESRKYYLQFEG